MNSQEEIQNLKRMIEKLTTDFENYKNSMQNSNLIPIGVDQALRSRLGIGQTGLNLVGTGGSSAGNTTTINAFPFQLPANPSGCITVVWNGQTYNLLYK